MKWVKSTDRSPEKDGHYFVRDHHGKRAYYWISKLPYDLPPTWVRSYPRQEADDTRWYICKECTNFEWMDETILSTYEPCDKVSHQGCLHPLSSGSAFDVFNIFTLGKLGSTSNEVG
jgi:hypothetical protein